MSQIHELITMFLKFSEHILEFSIDLNMEFSFRELFFKVIQL